MDELKDRLKSTLAIIAVLLCGVAILFYKGCDKRNDANPVIYKLNDVEHDTIWRIVKDTFYMQGKAKIKYLPQDTFIVTNSKTYTVPQSLLTIDTLSPHKDTLNMRIYYPQGSYKLTFKSHIDSIPQINTTKTVEKVPTWYQQIMPYLEGIGLGVLLTWLFHK